ncbi:choice-of-anchor L domain-containing protein [Chryseobacterium sp. T1]
MDTKMTFSTINLRILIYSLLLSLSCINIKSQYINVDTSYNAQQLVDKFLGSGNSCITVSNVKMSGWDFGNGNTSYGFFDKGTSSFDMKEGIILSSGNALDAIGPNNSLQSATNSAWKGDADLEQAININPSSSYDATYIEFDFVSNNSSKIFFDYMFLSEQYLRSKDNGRCDYTDGFAFLIKKQGDTNYKNLAVIPGTNTPIKSNTVRGGGEKCEAINEAYFGQYNYNTSATNFNGETKILTATTDVIPGQVYHIKLVVADQGNGLYDSAVFLKAGSFVGNKDLGKDLTLGNGNALCFGSSKIINATTPGAIKYTWYKDSVQIKSGNFPTHTVDYADAAIYEVEIELNSGCRLKGQLMIEQQIIPVLATNPTFSVCDDNLDGDTDVYFSSYINQIVTNISQDSGFDIKYFDQIPTNINAPTETPLPAMISFSGLSKDVWIWVKPGQCTPILQKITFNKNSLSQSNNIPAIKICDDKLEGTKTINLNDYIPALINNINGTPFFYKTESGAKNQNTVDRISPTEATNYKLTSDKTVYVRYHQAGLCDNVAPLSFIFKQPKKSLILADKIICKDTTTYLEAESNFDDYTWGSSDASSPVNGKKGSIVNNLPVGEYWVDLSSNGCTYRQFVKITASEEPQIKSIDINGSTVTVQIEGGTQPYSYAIDTNTYQNSNIFSNVKLGQHTIYIKYGDSCGPITMIFTVINPVNTITPNHDGINDVIDYSELATKTDPKVIIIDRYGKKIFDSTEKKTFIWDGTYNGAILPTASYWYILEWKEFGVLTPIQRTGWILLKNR